jgi:ubiquitin-like-conjugating enzyme ATG3
MNLLKGAVSAVMPQSVKSYALSTAEYLAPVMTESQFAERGMLTPDEFVAAGDLLILKCPTWQWAAGDASKARSYLPADKQFIVTRGVPCAQRAKALLGDVPDADDDDDDADADGWSTNWAGAARAPAVAGDGGVTGDADVAMLELGSTPSAASVAASASASAAAAVDAIPSMDDFEVAGLDDDDSDVAALGVRGLALGGDNVVRSRTYDLSITYDKYYRCPRVWLYGHDEARAPLSPAQVLEDISAEHANKTCTIEPHPHYEAGIYASIHPCRHAEVMKKLTEQLGRGDDDDEADGAATRRAAPRVDHYLILFLKFISTVIPTIEYDYTMSFEGF